MRATTTRIQHLSVAPAKVATALPQWTATTKPRKLQPAHLSKEQETSPNCCTRLQLTPQQTTRSRTVLSEKHPSLNASFNSLDRLRAITPGALTGTFTPKPETACNSLSLCNRIDDLLCSLSTPEPRLAARVRWHTLANPCKLHLNILQSFTDLCRLQALADVDVHVKNSCHQVHP